MAEYVICNKQDLVDIADAIREKTGDTNGININEFPEAVDDASMAEINKIIEGNITEVNSNVKTVRDYAFCECDSLTSANFPAATSIGGYAFKGCKSLSFINFPKVTTVEDFAFGNCKSLTTIDFPSVMNIKGSAFSDSYSIKEFIFRNKNMCSLDGGAFSLSSIISGTGYIYVPSATVYKYRATDALIERNRKLVRALEDYTVDGTITGALDPEKTSQQDPVFFATLEVEKMVTNTYANETTYSNEEFILLDVYPISGGTVNITYGELTKTITDDGSGLTPNAQQVFFGTFNGVSDDVETPSSGVLTISGDFHTFSVGTFQTAKGALSAITCNCIEGIVDWGDIVYLEDNAFKGCTKLTLTSLPDSLGSIGNNAFNGCTNLVLTSLPDTLNYIGSNAFKGCTNLTSITFENTTGWWVSTFSTVTSGTAVDVSNPVNNVTLLTNTYCNYYWHRS